MWLYLPHLQNHNIVLRHKICYIFNHVVLYFTIINMEININCDLGEKSKIHSNKNDPDLLNIVNSANVACGYHAGERIYESSCRNIKKMELVLELILHLKIQKILVVKG